jgi:HlyD family secretion protein
MTANVTIDVAVVRDVLRIPNSALRFKPDTAQVPAATTATTTSGVGQRAAGGGGATPPPGGGGERGMAGMGRGRGFGGAAGMMARTQAAPKRQTIYLLDDNKKLKPAQIRTGISDGRYTQVVDGDVKGGDSIVVGLVTSKVDQAAPPGSNRGPMSPGGAGGGRRGPG